MSTTTSKYGLTKPEDIDPVVDVLGTQLRALADKLDLLFGEMGTITMTPVAADTTVSVRVNYARDYTSTGSVPQVWVQIDQNTPTAATLYTWITAKDYTGFTLNMRKSTTANQALRWFARCWY